PLFAIGSIGAIGGLAALEQSQQNDAIRRAYEAESLQLTRQAMDLRTQRAERAQTFAGQVASRTAQTGMGGPARSAGSASLNVRELVTQAAGDAAVDVQIIDDELRAQLDALKARAEGGMRNPFLAGAQASLQTALGFM